MKKGFTLLELLIVIGILAILSTTMVLVINPAEMLRKARDSQRISDLNTLKTAIAMYLTDVPSASLSNGSYAYNHSGVTIPAGPCAGYTFTHSSTSQAITGIGWIPINFASITGGSPIGSEPIDPNPATGRYYVYISNTNNVFELLANMESTAYSNGGGNDVESKDGGNLPDYYEVGTSMIATTSTGCY